jgi:hypothetical protein
MKNKSRKPGAFYVKPKDVKKFIDPNYKYKKGVETTIDLLLQALAKNKTRCSYSEGASNLDFNLEHGKASVIVGKACGALWEYCHENGIPWLNMLVVRKAEQIPLGGVEKWYVNKFKSLTGYAKYCEMQANLAESMLQCSTIEIAIM